MRPRSWVPRDASCRRLRRCGSTLRWSPVWVKRVAGEYEQSVPLSEGFCGGKSTAGANCVEILVQHQLSGRPCRKPDDDKRPVLPHSTRPGGSHRVSGRCPTKSTVGPSTRNGTIHRSDALTCAVASISTHPADGARPQRDRAGGVRDEPRHPEPDYGRECHQRVVTNDRVDRAADGRGEKDEDERWSVQGRTVGYRPCPASDADRRLAPAFQKNGEDRGHVGRRKETICGEDSGRP